jgi:hypothetical protein
MAAMPTSNKAPLSQPVPRDRVPEVFVDERMMICILQTRDQRPRRG